MSVITFPRRVDTGRARPRTRPEIRPDTRPDIRRRPTHVAVAPRRRAVTRTWRGASSLRKSCVVVILALALSMAGSMVVANRQVQLHSLQSQLLQAQSTYAEQVGSNTDLVRTQSHRDQGRRSALGLPRLGDASPVHVT